MLIPTPRRILVARDPVDFRKSIDGLAAVCQLTLAEQPLDGSLYVFTNRRRNGLKMLIWSHGGFVRKAEQLAQELELIRLARKGPASQRFVPDGQALLPFTTGVEPPPRAPVDTPQSDAESTEEAVKVKRPGSKKPRRRNRQDLRHLDSQPVHVPAADQTCRSCGEPLVKIGVAESFRVEWIPGRFIVHDIARDKCACRNCPSEGVLTAAGPEQARAARLMGPHGTQARPAAVSSSSAWQTTPSSSSRLLDSPGTAILPTTFLREPVRPGSLSGRQRPRRQGARR